MADNVILNNLLEWQRTGNKDDFFKENKLIGIVWSQISRARDYFNLSRDEYMLYKDDLESECYKYILIKMPKFKITSLNDGQIVNYIKSLCKGAIGEYARKYILKYFQEHNETKSHNVVSYNDTNNDLKEKINCIPSNDVYSRPQKIVESNCAMGEIINIFDRELGEKKSQIMQMYTLKGYNQEEISEKLSMAQSTISYNINQSNNVIESSKELIKENLKKVV